MVSRPFGILLILAMALPHILAGDALFNYSYELKKKMEKLGAKLSKGEAVSAEEIQALPPKEVWGFIPGLLTIEQVASMPPEVALPILVIAGPHSDKTAKKIEQIPGWNAWFEKRLAELAQFKDRYQRFGGVAPHFFADEFLTPELEQMIPNAREQMDAARERGVESVDRTMYALVEGQAEMIRAEQQTLVDTLSRIGSVESIRLIGPYLFAEGMAAGGSLDVAPYDPPSGQAFYALRVILNRRKEVGVPRTGGVPAMKQWWRENAAEYGGVVPEIKTAPPVTPPPKRSVPAATPSPATPKPGAAPPSLAERAPSATKSTGIVPWLIAVAVVAALALAFALKPRSRPPT